MKIKKEYVEAMGGSKKPQDGPRQESKRKFDIRLVQGYINEIDRRRNTNFLETFPEFDEFFSVCKKARENV